jgi:hypothetical protein
LTNFGNGALALPSPDVGAVVAVEVFGLRRMVIPCSLAAERP